MKKEELRVGNYVKLAVDDITVFHRITEIGDTCETFSNGDIAHYDIRDLEPILITDDWLMSFGFIPNKFGYRKESLHLSKDTETGFFEPVLNRLNGVDGNEKYIFSPDDKGANFWIKTVHQLQNFHFALTNIDLV